jgi:hypothetical protein
MNVFSFPEMMYPIDFREEEAKRLGQYLKHRQSVNVIGMRRVGISNFLRFFVYHKEIISTYVSIEQRHLFIPVDLNDLVEREVYPFWNLTMKRIFDACLSSSLLQRKTKEKLNRLFLASIQSHDLFFIIDTIRDMLRLIGKEGIYPTLFFIRFDRLQDVFNASLFDNFEGLYDAMHEQLSYVFTSHRSLDSLFPDQRTSLSVFAQQLYFPLAKKNDIQIIYSQYKEQYDLSFSSLVEKKLFRLVGGNVQYLQLALIVLQGKKRWQMYSEKELLHSLVMDERIMLESEELWESLTEREQAVLVQVTHGDIIEKTVKKKAAYLWETGFITIEENLFSPLFSYYLLQKEAEKVSISIDLTRKEYLLFALLQEHLGELCTREEIVHAVWSEYKEFDVSDWAIDRLVARIRIKLRKQQSHYEVITVRTRGYKLSTIKK